MSSGSTLEGITHSLAAIGNIKTILEAYLTGRYDLSVIDVFQNPGLRDQDRVMALPTLVKCAPMPGRKIIGDLSDTQRVLIELGLLSPEGLGLHAE